MEVVTKKKKITNKLMESGKLVVIVGYDDNHAKGTYNIFVLKTGKCILTRDVKWLSLCHGDWIDPKSKVSRNDPDLNHEPDVNSESSDEDDIVDNSLEEMVDENSTDKEEDTFIFNNLYGNDETLETVYSEYSDKYKRVFEISETDFYIHSCEEETDRTVLEENLYINPLEIQ